jgi:hypothetical protein
MQHMQDSNVVSAYGATEPSFGGVYFDGDVVVALFTSDVRVHDEVLRPRLTAPDQFRAELADRSWATVEAANRSIQEALLFTGPRIPGVNSVGIGKMDGQFAIKVGIDPYSEELAEQVRRAASPFEVVVHQQGVARRL